MNHRSTRSPGWSGILALFLAAAGVLSVVGVYFEMIPARFLGDAAGAGGGQGRGDRPRAGVARVQPRPAPKAGPDREIVHDEGDGESPARVGPAETPKGPVPEAPKTPTMVEYEARARETPDTPAEQKRLAVWCEKRGLAVEARSHWEAVVRLRPDDPTARGKLGFRRRGGKWLTEAMIADEEEQARADKVWLTRLNNLHRRMHATDLDAAAGREKARQELGEVTDPLAAFTLWRVFAGHPSHHLMVARQLGRISSPKSSRMLAAVAAYSTDEKARSAAVEELKGRDPVEFAGPLIALLGPTLKVRQVALPSAPGEPRLKAIEIEDERFYRQFVYMAATVPTDPSAEAFGGGCSQAVRSMNSGWTTEGRQMARELNRAEARISEVAADRQLRDDLAAVAALNREIARRNERVGSILAETTRADFGADREGWDRWFAGIQGVKYFPPRQARKVALAQFVEPMYRPSFVAVPPAPS